MRAVHEKGGFCGWDVKMDVLGSIFSGKMVFENGKCRTAEFNPIIAILMGREPFFNEKGASADAETPLRYPEPGSPNGFCGNFVKLN